MPMYILTTLSSYIIADAGVGSIVIKASGNEKIAVSKWADSPKLPSCETLN
jgi:hypothetical protein